MSFEYHVYKDDGTPCPCDEPPCPHRAHCAATTFECVPFGMWQNGRDWRKSHAKRVPRPARPPQKQPHACGGPRANAAAQRARMHARRRRVAALRAQGHGCMEIARRLKADAGTVRNDLRALEAPASIGTAALLKLWGR